MVYYGYLQLYVFLRIIIFCLVCYIVIRKSSPNSLLIVWISFSRLLNTPYLPSIPSSERQLFRSLLIRSHLSLLHSHPPGTPPPSSWGFPLPFPSWIPLPGSHAFFFPDLLLHVCTCGASPPAAPGEVCTGGTFVEASHHILKCCYSLLTLLMVWLGTEF